MLAAGKAMGLVFRAHPGQVVAQVLHPDLTDLHIAGSGEPLLEMNPIHFGRAVAQAFGGFVLRQSGERLGKLKDWRSMVHFDFLLGARSSN